MEKIIYFFIAKKEGIKMTFFRLIVFAVLLIAEMATAGTLVSIWFSFGALAAFFV